MEYLKNRMINELYARRLSDRTHKAYLHAFNKIAAHYKRPPDELSEQEIKDFLVFLLKEKKLSTASVRQIINGLFFFYYKVLKRSRMELDLPMPKLEKKLPEILNAFEVNRLINNTENEKQKTLLMTAYATGVRVSELVKIKISDIDSKRMVIRIEQGKGNKDRYTILSPLLLKQLRKFYRMYRPYLYMFNGQHPASSLSACSVQRAFRVSCCKSNITKKVSVHSLRHAFSTQQILNGMLVTELQIILGHTSLSTTMKYVHLARMPTGASDSSVDLLGLLNQVEEDDHD